MTFSQRSKLFLAVALSLMATQASRGETFLFRDGRALVGEVIGVEEVPLDKTKQKQWIVELPDGSFVKILESQIKLGGVRSPKDALAEYAALVKRIQENAEDHYKMGRWCKKNELHNLARAHYLRVLDFSPNHPEARAATDYIEDRNGQWVKQDKAMRDRGKIKYRGSYRFPDAVKIEQAEEAAKAASVTILKNITTWHSSVVRSPNTKRGQTAFQNLQGVNDPLAVPIIGDYLLERRNRNYGKADASVKTQLKRLYVRIIAQFQQLNAAQILAEVSMQAPEQVVRQDALAALDTYGRDVANRVYASYLTNPGKKPENKLLINRAADNLAYMNAQLAVLPLIRALITEHEKMVSSNNTYSTGGLALGNQNKKVKEISKNTSVLNALKQLTGQSFGFEPQQWMAWYASVHAAPAKDLRRDS